jgi:hypothetical protein
MLQPHLRSREWLPLLAGFNVGFGVMFVALFAPKIGLGVNRCRENACGAESCLGTGKTGFALRSAAWSLVGSTRGASDLPAEAVITFRDVKKKACHTSKALQNNGLNKETTDVVFCAASKHCQATQIWRQRLVTSCHSTIH